MRRLYYGKMDPLREAFQDEKAQERVYPETLGDRDPVTGKAESSKACNRKRTRTWKKELPELRPVFCGQKMIRSPTRIPTMAEKAGSLL